MRGSLTRIGAISGNTFREAVRNKLLYNLLFFAILMIASSVFLANLHLGYRIRIFHDVGLSAIAIFGALIAIFVGINLVYREISLRTVYTMLAKPVQRWEFLLGKYAGLVGLLLVEIGIMGGGLALVLASQEMPVSIGLFYAVGLIFVELALITAVALFFSSFTTPYLAGMFTVALWVTGHLLGDLRAFGSHSGVPALEALTEFLYWFLPNLDRLDVKAEAAAGVPIEVARVAGATVYALTYSCGLLLVASWLFRRRDFK